ncbi:hypothetical protein JEZ13_00470 [bacterium]|nr:hypothetical protein [bacterium]
MQNILQDIRNKLKSNVYKNEELVRVAIVSRILNNLKWDIWDPQTVYFEYPVQKLTQNQNNASSYGKVDIALFLTQGLNQTPEVYIETKAIGNLISDLSECEKQLQLYNSYDMSIISILTDGNVWKFYLSSAGGSFSQRLFNEFNIIDDPDSYIINILNKILHKDNYRQAAIITGHEMLEERDKIQHIDLVKNEAIEASNKYGYDKYQTAKNILSRNYHKEYGINEIQSLWNYKRIDQPISISSTLPIIIPESLDTVDLANFNPKGKRPKKAFIIDKWYDVSSWRGLLIQVSTILIEKYPNTTLCGFYFTTNRWAPNVSVIKINDKYLNVNFSSSACINQIQRYLSSHNYDPNISFKLIIAD